MKKLVSTGFAATVLVLGAFVPSAAQAAPAPIMTPSAAAADDGETYEVSSSAPAQGAQAPAVIKCTVKAHHPHGSHTVNGRVNFHTDVTCDRSVGSITMSATMRRGDGKHGATKSFQNAGKAHLGGNANMACSKTKKNFHGTASVVIVFPPRYVPPSASAQVRSKTVSLKCGD